MRAKGLEEYPVRLVCQTLGISRSAYYARKRQPSTPKENRDAELLRKAKAIFQETYEEYGRIRMHRAMQDDGEEISLGKTRKLMQEGKLVPKKSRKYKATTNSKHKYQVAENLLNREFEAKRPNQKWCGDSTYIWTDEGWLYASGIIDLCGRGCVGLSFSERHTQELMISTLRQAQGKYKPEKGLLFHSDRGVQYAATAFKAELAKYGMIQSMSRTGVPYDNAPMESFWSTVKAGCVHGRKFRTRHEAEMTIFQYVFGFYNTRRYHTTNALMTPNEYRKQREKAA